MGGGGEHDVTELANSNDSSQRVRWRGPLPLGGKVCAASRGEAKGGGHDVAAQAMVVGTYEEGGVLRGSGAAGTEAIDGVRQGVGWRRRGWRGSL